MAFHQFISAVAEALDQPLPGKEAQMRMASMRRIQEIMHSVMPAKPRPSGVLLFLYPMDNEPYIVFIRRPEYGGVHSGQISFPGGKQEPHDMDLSNTAMRESHEEVGIIPGKVRILGKLSDLYIPPSKFLVSPFLGYSTERPEFKRDPSEVDEVIEIKLSDLFRDQSVHVVKITTGLGVQIKTPAYVVDGTVIWGATAMILSEFREVIRPIL